MNTLYFNKDDFNISINLNLLIILANKLCELGYKIEIIESKGYDTNISFSDENLEGIISYENGGNIFLMASNANECIELFNTLNFFLEVKKIIKGRVGIE